MDQELERYIKSNPLLSLSNKAYCLAKTTIRQGEEIHILKHCFSNFSTRLTQSSSNAPKGEKSSLEILCELLRDGRKVRRKNNVIQLINHGFKRTKYLFSEGWILIIEEGNILKTAYQIDSQKRKEMYPFENP